MYDKNIMLGNLLHGYILYGHNEARETSLSTHIGQHYEVSIHFRWPQLYVLSRSILQSQAASPLASTDPTYC